MFLSPNIIFLNKKQWQRQRNQPTACFIGSSEILNPKTHIDGPEYLFEFDEADFWPANDVIATNQHETKNYKVSRPLRKPKTTKARDHRPIGPRSLPVDVPDWSKILRGEYRRHGGVIGFDAYEDIDEDGDIEDFDGNDKIPPHEYLARTRVASFSVHEGVGRTLKGMDMSRVRDAIWKQIGFED